MILVNQPTTDTLQLSIHHWVDRRATVAIAEAVDDDGLRVPQIPAGVGIAHCHPRDSFDPSIGQQLASSRAIASLGTSLAHANLATIDAMEQSSDTEFTSLFDELLERLGSGDDLFGPIDVPEEPGLYRRFTKWLGLA